MVDSVESVSDNGDEHVEEDDEHEEGRQHEEGPSYPGLEAVESSWVNVTQCYPVHIDEGIEAICEFFVIGMAVLEKDEEGLSKCYDGYEEYEQELFHVNDHFLYHVDVIAHAPEYADKVKETEPNQESSKWVEYPYNLVW